MEVIDGECRCIDGLDTTGSENNKLCVKNNTNITINNNNSG